MTLRVELSDDTFHMRAQIMRLEGITAGELNRIVASGKVRIRRLPNAHPRLSLADVRAVLAESLCRA